MESVWPDNGMNEELAATASCILGFDFSGRVDPLTFAVTTASRAVVI